MATQFLVPASFVRLSAAPASPVGGWVYFDTTKNKLQLYTGSAWVDVPGSGGGGGGPNPTDAFSLALTANDTNATPTDTLSLALSFNDTLTAPGLVVASDAFGRTASNSWGTADQGGTWVNIGTASFFSVTPGAGVINADSVTEVSILGVSYQDVEGLIKVTPATMTSAYADFGVCLRTSSGTTWYQFSAYYATGNNSGNYTIEVKRKPANTQIVSDVNTAIAGGTAVWMRYQAQGINPTTLRWRMWAVGSGEPTTWTTTTDSTSGLQVAGGVGVQAYCSSGSAALSFNSFQASDLSAPGASISDAVTLGLTFPDSNSTPTDSIALLGLRTNEVNVTPTDAASYAMTFSQAESNVTPTDAITTLALGGYNDSNVVPTDHAVAQITYTATGSWVCPTGVTSATVECRGGGAGGAVGTTTGGTGGAGGDYAKSVQSVSGGTTYTVTVGATSAVGGAGNDSWFNTATTVRAKGGGSANSTIGTTTFAGGAGAAGAVLAAGGGGGGGAGDAGVGGAASGATAGTGGTARGGAGGAGQTGAGSAGTAPGGGGGGGGGSATSPGAGSTGARGEIRITWTMA